MKKTLLKKAAVCALLGVMLSVSAMGSAHADPRDRDDRGWHAHERWAHHDWHRPPPRVVYTPPVVYAPPPPVEESSGINLILPLHFR